MSLAGPVSSFIDTADPVCIYVYICVYMYMYECIYIWALLGLRRHPLIRLILYVYLYIYMRVYVYTYMYEYVCVYVGMYTTYLCEPC